MADESTKPRQNQLGCAACTCAYRLHRSGDHRPFAATNLCVCIPRSSHFGMNNRQERTPRTQNRQTILLSNGSPGTRLATAYRKPSDSPKRRSPFRSYLNLLDGPFVCSLGADAESRNERVLCCQMHSTITGTFKMNRGAIHRKNNFKIEREIVDKAPT